MRWPAGRHDYDLHWLVGINCCGRSSTVTQARKRTTSKNSFDRRGHITTQFLCPPQCSLNPDNLQFAGRDLSSWFVMITCGTQAALVAGKHTSEDRNGTFLRLRMGASEADQASGAMLAGGQGRAWKVAQRTQASSSGLLPERRKLVSRF